MVCCYGAASEENRSLSNFPTCPPNETRGDPCIMEAFCPRHDRNESCTVLISHLKHKIIEESQSKLSDFSVWMYSFISAFIISVAGVWGYLFLPLMEGPYRVHVMNVLVGLSFGSLTTSAICQLIPEAFELGKLTRSSDYLHVAIYSMIGLWLTWFLQSLASIIGKDYEEQVNQAQKTVELKTTQHNKTLNPPEKGNNGCSVYTFPADSENGKRPVVGEITKGGDDFPAKLIHRPSFASYSNLKKKSPKLSKLAIVILVGDCMNNFMDGISIGAGYSYCLSTGIKLSAAIAFEEYTHKLGDFAIVFQSGVPMSRVLFWNYTTSCACFIGIVIGIALGNLHWSTYIFSFASGLFLFIALSNMIPEMQNMLDESLNSGRKSGFITLFEQHIGFLLSFVLLLIISVILNSTSGFSTINVK